MDKPSGILPPGLANYSVENQTPAKTNELGQETFLELMVAQLENQDPLNPMESADFLGQLAQFSTVTGIGELQESFATLAGSLQSSMALQASTIVGREVLVPAQQIDTAADGEAVSGAVTLPQASGALTLEVFNEAGSLVRRVDLGAHQAGQVRFAWDGMSDAGVAAPAGKYTLEARAILGEESIALPTMISARVDSVSLVNGQNPQLNLDRLGTVGMEQVQQLL